MITPIELETTQLGMDFESLKMAIAPSTNQIDPYNWVSFRILHQMANLLQNQYPQGTYLALAAGDNDESEALIKAYQANLELKKTYEYRFWEAKQDINADIDNDEL